MSTVDFHLSFWQGDPGEDGMPGKPGTPVVRRLSATCHNKMQSEDTDSRSLSFLLNNACLFLCSGRPEGAGQPRDSGGWFRKSSSMIGLNICSQQLGG